MDLTLFPQVPQLFKSFFKSVQNLPQVGFGQTSVPVPLVQVSVVHVSFTHSQNVWMVG